MQTYKIGDWVRIHGKPTQILRIEGIETNEPEYYDYINGYHNGCLDPNELELWVPIKDEWCWWITYDDPILIQWRGSLNKHPMIGSMDIVEPFIGQLPSILLQGN